MKFRSSTTIFGIIFSITLSSNAFAQSPGALAEIEQLYTQGNYSQAISLIDEQMKSYSANANLHYLKANILAARGETAQAASEYEAAMHYNPSPTVKNYCERALALLGAPAQAASTMSALDKQAGHEVRRTQKQSAAAGRQMAAESSEYQRNHSAKTGEIVNRMQNAGFYDHDNDWVPMYGPADIAAVQARRQAKEDSIVNGFTRSTQEAQNAAQQHNSAVVDSAEGLKSQMVHPVRAGEPVLDPNGTNLFVRNYSEPASPSAVTASPRPATVTVP